MEIKQFVISEYAVNCYLLVEGNEAILIDVAHKPFEIEQYLEENNIKLSAILITHAHVDHIAGLEQLRNKVHAPVYLHKEEEGWLSDVKLNGSFYVPFFGLITCEPAEHYIENEGIIKIGKFEIKPIHTPGHTPGGISFYINNILFSGDTLFYRTIGRTDFHEGNASVLYKSIREKLYTLPADTQVFPAHGEKTTIGYEKNNNPFVQ